MMRTTTEQSNTAMHAFCQPTSSQDDDAASVYTEVLGAGWSEVDGCWLLDFFARSYHGSRESFVDRTGFEAAANGRAVPDEDLPLGAERALFIAQRGAAFARHALALLPDDAPAVTAFVSVGPTGYDESIFTGNVTFYADHEDEAPYLDDIDSYDRGILLLRSVPPGPAESKD